MLINECKVLVFVCLLLKLCLCTSFVTPTTVDKSVDVTFQNDKNNTGSSNIQNVTNEDDGTGEKNSGANNSSKNTDTDKDLDITRTRDNKDLNTGSKDGRDKKHLHVGILAPYVTSLDLYTFKAAIHTAAKLINKDERILKDYILNISYYDSRALIGFSYLNFYKMIEEQPIKQILIGPNYPDMLNAIAELTELFQIPQVSRKGAKSNKNKEITFLALHRFDSKLLSQSECEGEKGHKKKFPNLVKVAPSQISFNEANVRLFQHFKWRRVAILYSYTFQQYFATAYDLSIRLRKVGIDPVVVQGFFEDSLSINSQLQAIVDEDIRVIFGVFGKKGAKRIFCEAYNWNLYGEKYQWITVSTLADNWWVRTSQMEPYNCTYEQRLRASDGYMRTTQTDIRRDSVETIAGLKPEEVWHLIEAEKRRDFKRYWSQFKPSRTPDISKELNKDSNFAFDAVYLAAKTLETVIKEKGEEGLLKDYKDRDKVKYFAKTALKQQFEAVTGQMLFGGPSGDERFNEITIQQFRINASQEGAKFIDIGYYDIENKTLDFNTNDAALFKGTKVIKDRKTIIKIPRHFSVTVLSILWSLAAAGLILSFIVLVINVRYRQIRMIKMSSPNINNGIIAGSIITYASVIIYGLDGRFLTTRGIQISCNAITIALSIGFTLSFGCLFSKTWRIYKIFTAAKTMDKVSIKDSHLYGIVLLLVSVDVAVFLLWVIVSPFTVEETILSKEIYEQEDMIKVFFYYKCSCVYQLHFTVATYCYKGFLLIFGLFLAWETRNVKVAVLNDSKYIGMAVYNVCVVSAVGVVCTSALYNTAHYTTGYLVVTISIFLCTTGILLLIFVPKISLLFGKSFNITYGNISVRTFSSYAKSANVFKSNVSSQHSTSTSDVQSEPSTFENRQWQI